MRRLFLHVGTHKTGTTSLQHFLMEARPRLLDSGLAFFHGLRPRPGRAPQELGNAWVLGQAFLRADLLTVMRLKALADPRIGGQGLHEKDRLLAFARAHPGHDLMVSAEVLSYARTGPEARHLRAFADRLGCVLHPVLVQRNEADWRASKAAQLVKMGYGGPEVERRPDGSRVDSDWSFDRDAIRAFWQALGPCAEIDYDAAIARDGSVIPAVMRAIGRPEILPAKDVRLNSRAGAAPPRQQDRGAGAMAPGMEDETG